MQQELGSGQGFHQQLCHVLDGQRGPSAAAATWGKCALRAQLSAAGQGRSWQSDTALIYAAALAPKASEGSSLYRNPVKTRAHRAHSPSREPRCRALCAWEKSACRWGCCLERDNRWRPLPGRLPEPRPNAPRGLDTALLRCLRQFLALPGQKARPGAVSITHPPLSCTVTEQLQGSRLLQGCDVAAGSRSLLSPAKGSLRPQGPPPAGSPAGLSQEPAGSQQRFPEPVFALAAPALPSRRQAPGGNSWMSKTRSGSRAGIWSGTGWLPGVGRWAAYAPTLHSCRAAPGLGFPTGSPARALCLLSSPTLGGNNVTCYTSSLH